MGRNNGDEPTPPEGGTSSQSPADITPDVDYEQLRTLIHQKLDEFRAGDLYMEYELTERDYPSLLSDKDIFGKFETILGKTWAQIDTASKPDIRLNGGKQNKKKKKFVEAVKSEAEFVHGQIEVYNNLLESANTSSADHPSMQQDQSSIVHTNSSLVITSEQSPHNHHHEEANHQEGYGRRNTNDEVRLDENNSARKKSKKRKKKSRDTKNDAPSNDKEEHRKKKKRRKTNEVESNNNNNNDDAMDGDLDKDDRDQDADIEMGAPSKKTLRRYNEAKAEFERGKEHTLKNLDDNIKKDFREVGFGKWSRDWLPMIQLGPYDIPPGAARDEWFKMFNKLKKKSNRLIYWYGSPHDDLSSAYSIISKSQIKSYEAGKKMNLHKCPAKVQKKIDSKKKLNATDMLYAEGLPELEADREKAKEDRVNWIDVKEDYEEILQDGDIDDLEEDEDEIIDEPAPAKKQKKKKGKKKSIENEEINEPSTTSKEKKRKRKDCSPEKSVKQEQEDDFDKEVEKNAVKDNKKKKKKKLKKNPNTPTVDEVEDDEDHHSIQSHHGADDDFSLNTNDKRIESDDDDDDDDFKPTSIKKKKKKPARKEKPIEERKTPKKQPPKKMTKKRCQEMFEECEDKFLPIMERLKSAKKESTVKSCLAFIEKNIETIVPSFIKQHKIGIVIKEVRKKFKQSCKAECQTITNALKTAFSDNRNNELKDFQPKLKIRGQSKANEPKETPQPSPRPLSPKEPNKEVTKKDGAIKENIDIPIKKKNADKDLVQIPRISNSAKKEVKNERPQVGQKPPEKTKQQKFSLLPFKPKPNPTNTYRPVKIDSNTKTEIRLPKWITTTTTNLSDKNLNSERSFAMEFLTDAVSDFPTDKINPIAIAHGLEEAAFLMYDADMKSYWEKIHDLCAALAGKKQIGSLGKKIIEGQYSTPMLVLAIPRKLLFQSFEGYSIS